MELRLRRERDPVAAWRLARAWAHAAHTTEEEKVGWPSNEPLENRAAPTLTTRLSETPPSELRLTSPRYRRRAFGQLSSFRIAARTSTEGRESSASQLSQSRDQSQGQSQTAKPRSVAQQLHRWYSSGTFNPAAGDVSATTAISRTAAPSPFAPDSSLHISQPPLSREALLALLLQMQEIHRLEPALGMCLEMGLGLDALLPLSRDVQALVGSMLLPPLDVLLRALVLRLLLLHPEVLLSRSQQAALTTIAQAVPRTFADAVTWPLFHSVNFSPSPRAALGRVLQDGGSTDPSTAGAWHMLLPEAFALHAQPQGMTASTWVWTEARNGFLLDLVGASGSISAEAARQLAHGLLAADDGAHQQPSFGKLWLQFLKMHGAKFNATMCAAIRIGLARHASFVKPALLRLVPDA